ncbi:hypothetical protein KC887_04470 [Candidatus Kaiserbacteria bacterium]|nr:hypothetical protein [Candidatus Kaiserbacteria bacterium]
MARTEPEISEARLNELRKAAAEGNASAAAELRRLHGMPAPDWTDPKQQSHP